MQDPGDSVNCPGAWPNLDERSDVDERTCSIEGCDNKVTARGWCQKHYVRWHRWGDPLGVKPKPPRDACNVDDCDKPSFCRGRCRIHDDRWRRNGATELPPRARTNNQRIKPLAERFWAKVEKTDDCWLWTGGKTKLGYGSLWSHEGRRSVMAHRVSWEIVNGSIPDGLHIDHLCRRPSCVRPDHLEPVTRAENTRRGYSPSIGAAFNLAKTHCPQGHPYEGVNLYVSKHGRRSCLTCINTRSKARRRALRDGVPYVDPFLLDSSGRKSM